jgi:hypothetical protein
MVCSEAGLTQAGRGTEDFPEGWADERGRREGASALGRPWSTEESNCSKRERRNFRARICAANWLHNGRHATNRNDYHAPAGRTLRGVVEELPCRSPRRVRRQPFRNHRSFGPCRGCTLTVFVEDRDGLDIRNERGIVLAEGLKHATNLDKVCVSATVQQEDFALWVARPALGPTAWHLIADEKRHALKEASKPAHAR